MLLGRQQAAGDGADRGYVVVDVGVVDGRVLRSLQRPVTLDLAEHQHQVRAGDLLHQFGRLRQVDPLDLGGIGKVAAGGRATEPGEPGAIQAEPLGPHAGVGDPHPVRDQGEGRLLPLDIVDAADRGGRIDVADGGFDGLRVPLDGFGVHGVVLEGAHPLLRAPDGPPRPRPRQAGAATGEGGASIGPRSSCNHARWRPGPVALPAPPSRPWGPAPSPCWW